MEYRYWVFMESHPAHAALPFAAHREAMDVLTWAWTDRLLPPQHEEPLPSPFTQSECQELLGIMRSFGDNPQSETGIQSIVLTRIVSRILLRVAHWRQQHFRPDKPLPVEPSVNGHLARHGSRRVGFGRTVLEVLVSCLLLGVPYLFYKRPGAHTSTDAEGGIGGRSSLPALVVGACTCLLAAILLSASITFLSLPGLDNIARLAALVAVLLAACSMASSVLALFTYKAELAEAARPASHLNPGRMRTEGLMLISTKSIIKSLPLVLLIYAVMGFVAAVVVYSFLGVNGSAVPFAQYTRWAVLGVLGGLLGVLATSVLLLRR
ncbi:hypothetical protein C8J57DRAFT_1437696 [Mycena rebaudengoi]|nr:hypothetical protein C8J57DRAFT_1438654 [Mycena rebaudengoi]KAJ7250802.1 hypothetical protein C8J57DRAFT_1437696 [Mycena rebaudengoi]